MHHETRRLNLRDIAKIRTGLVLNRFKGNIHFSNHYPYNAITLKSFSSSGRFKADYIDQFVANTILPTNYFTCEGDILVRLREPNDAILIDRFSAGLVVPSFVAIIQVHKDTREINLEFLTYYLNSQYTKKILNKDIQGTTIPMIQIKDLLNLSIQVPPILIQDKIVALLNTGQKEIDLLEQLILQKQKKLLYYTNQLLQ